MTAQRYLQTPFFMPIFTATLTSGFTSGFVRDVCTAICKGESDQPQLLRQADALQFAGCAFGDFVHDQNFAGHFKVS